MKTVRHIEKLFITNKFSYYHTMFNKHTKGFYTWQKVKKYVGNITLMHIKYYSNFLSANAFFCYKVVFPFLAPLAES